jgi:predicted esterase
MAFPAVRIPAIKAPSAAIIFLHGLGDTGNGWSFLAQEAFERKFQHIGFVFPHAPNKPISVVCK